MYTGATTGVTTNEGQHAFFINENGLPAVKSGSQTIVFSTSGSAFTGSSGSSGLNGSKGSSGSSGVSGTSGQDGAPGDIGAAGSNGTNGSSGTSGINGVDGAAGSSGANGSSGSSGQTYGTSGSSGATGSSGSSGAPGAAGSSGSSGQEGLASYTVTTTANITKTSGNIFTKTSGGDSWNSGFYSLQGFRSAYVGGTPLSTTGLALIGMSSGSITTNDPTFIDYGIGVYSGSTNIVVIESGTVVYTHGSAPISTTRYLINYDIQNVRYYIDGTLVHTTSRSELGTLFMDAAIYTQGAGFSNVSFGASGPVGPAGGAGTSGTSAGGGGGDTLQTQQVGIAASQPTIYGSATQWRAIYGDANDLDQGSGGQYDNQEFGFIQPLFLEAGETIEKVGFYMMDYTSSGTAAFKVIICDKHPNAYLPWNLLHSETLTFTHDDADNKFISWDYDFTNTGSTRNTYFVYVLFASEETRTFEICRTIQNPEYLTQDTRLITSSNRFDGNSHWYTGYHNIYSSLPATMEGIISSYFFYNNQRGAHMYYQTSRT